MDRAFTATRAMPSRRYLRAPVEHRTRVTVVTNSGERLVGETGGDKDNLGAPRTDAQIEQKFRALSEDVLGATRVNTILDRLWHLEDLDDMAAIPPPRRGADLTSSIYLCKAQ